MEKILIVEDADSLREVIVSLLQTKNFDVEAFASAEPALEAMQRTTFSCVLADFKLPGMNGIQFLREVRRISQTVPFILMTAFGSIEIAVEAMKEGANDFLCKPFEPSVLAQVLHDVIEHRRIINRGTSLRSKRERRFLTQSPEVKRMMEQAQRAARVDTSILLLGESGTGKELVARYIHENSSRKDQAFIAVNCAAMPADLLESEFFGHEAGAFTGATQTRVGVFELASEGTIFLDEIGDMSLQLQVKLLRALQEREIKRVGGNKTIKVNPRIISATNHVIDDALNNGTLREDFYYRLAVVTFTIPPLRDRPEDLGLLVDHFIDLFSKQAGKDNLLLDKTASEMLHHYRWPGNTRELENVIERAVILADATIRPEHLGINLALEIDSIDNAVATLGEVAKRAAMKAEVDMITRILAQTAGNKTKAAQLLGVSYKTFLNKVKEYNIQAH